MQKTLELKEKLEIALYLTHFSISTVFPHSCQKYCSALFILNNLGQVHLSQCSLCQGWGELWGTVNKRQRRFWAGHQSVTGPISHWKSQQRVNYSPPESAEFAIWIQFSFAVRRLTHTAKNKCTGRNTVNYSYFPDNGHFEKTNFIHSNQKWSHAASVFCCFFWNNDNKNLLYSLDLFVFYENLLFLPEVSPLYARFKINQHGGMNNLGLSLKVFTSLTYWNQTWHGESFQLQIHEEQGLNTVNNALCWEMVRKKWDIKQCRKKCQNAGYVMSPKELSERKWIIYRNNLFSLTNQMLISQCFTLLVHSYNHICKPWLHKVGPWVSRPWGSTWTCNMMFLVIVNYSLIKEFGKPSFYSPLITRYLPGKFMVTQKCY